VLGVFPAGHGPEDAHILHPVPQGDLPDAAAVEVDGLGGAHRPIVRKLGRRRKPAQTT
jgi:hypothetical protein